MKMDAFLLLDTNGVPLSQSAFALGKPFAPARRTLRLKSWVYKNVHLVPVTAKKLCDTIILDE
jgi:hypothetical protein